jgi:hypothetical protein
MPEKTVKRRLQDCDAALASDDGPIFSTVAKLVEALKRSIPEGTQNAELKQEALRLGRELLRGTKHEEEWTRSMKPRHAVALALVGWYLMVPPTKNVNQIDPSIPLPKWVVLRAFDTADACNEAQDQLRYRVSRLNLRVPVASAASEAAEFSQCIASDDPRLRGKWSLTRINAPWR